MSESTQKTVSLRKYDAIGTRFLKDDEAIFQGTEGIDSIILSAEKLGFEPDYQYWIAEVGSPDDEGEGRKVWLQEVGKQTLPVAGHAVLHYSYLLSFDGKFPA
jgi:hypothetical protein